MQEIGVHGGKAYMTHNPLTELIDLVPGSMEDEKKLHKEFNKYRYKNYPEWFTYNQEIVDRVAKLRGISKIDNTPRRRRRDQSVIKLPDSLPKEDIQKLREFILRRSDKTPTLNYIGSVKESDNIIDYLRIKYRLFRSNYALRGIVGKYISGETEMRINQDGTEVTSKNLLVFVESEKRIKGVIDILKLDKKTTNILSSGKFPDYPSTYDISKYPVTLCTLDEELGKIIPSDSVITMVVFSSELSNKYISLIPYLGNLAKLEGKNPWARELRAVLRTKTTASSQDLLRNSINDCIRLCEDILKESFKEETIKYYSDKLRILKDISNKIGLLTSLDNKFIEEFNNIPSSKDKMKFLCEYQFESESSKNQTLSSVSPAFYNYYFLLGPDRCKELGYRLDNLSKEYSNIKNKDKTNTELPKELDKIFKVDGEYTKAWIKETLKGIYYKIGYKRNAKASDLSDWYEIKHKLVKNASGKWEHGFKILKKL